MKRSIAVVLFFASITSSFGYVYDANDFAVEIVQSTGLSGSSIYNDPAAVLGRPTLKFDNETNPSVSDLRRIKITEGAFNTGPAGEKLITTLAANTSITVRMGRAVTNDPNNPFGVDFIVFGNSIFDAGGDYTGDDANLNQAVFNGLSADERVKVSVSPDNVNWYRYDNGPYGDSAFPTNSYLWDSSAAKWTDIKSDPTLPVDPSLAASVAGKTAANVLDTFYKGSAGGTGFDLSASGFSSIQYVRFEGLAGFANGEIDAVADVRAIVPEPLGVIGLMVSLAVRRRR